jgi:hypothetical protein
LCTFMAWERIVYTTCLTKYMGKSTVSQQLLYRFVEGMRERKGIAVQKK